MNESLAEIVRFYDATFVDSSLQEAVSGASGIDDFKRRILLEAQSRGFRFTRCELDDSFDGMGERNTFQNVDFGSSWISVIMRYGWVPKGYSR
jgi:hypothetical protein